MREPFSGFMTLSGQEFNRNPSEAKRSARKSPIVVLDRGEPDVVVVSAEDFARHYRPKRTVGEMLQRASRFDLDFEPGRFEMETNEVVF